MAGNSGDVDDRDARCMRLDSNCCACDRTLSRFRQSDEGGGRSHIASRGGVEASNARSHFAGRGGVEASNARSHFASCGCIDPSNARIRDLGARNPAGAGRCCETGKTAPGGSGKTSADDRGADDQTLS